jgi:DNA-binding CsgD family transcriptional regulator
MGEGMEKELLSHLAKKEHAELMVLSHGTLSCRSKNDLMKLVLDLKNVFDHDNAVLVYGNITEVFSKPQPALDLLNISFPQSCLDYYFKNRLYTADASFHEYLQRLRPVNWIALNKKAGFSSKAAIHGLSYDLRNGWTTGTFDPNSKDCCIMNLASLHTENNLRNRIVLEYITPFFAEAYRQVLNSYCGPVSKLTPSEIEVLKWLKHGKSSWEISVILKCSKRVVDFHVTNIKSKLNAVSRAQAVAIGLHQGIIKF